MERTDIFGAKRQPTNEEEFEDWARRCPYGGLDLHLFGHGTLHPHAPRRYLDITTHKAYLTWNAAREKGNREVSAAIADYWGNIG